jgi:hypothetical protein
VRSRSYKRSSPYTSTGTTDDISHVRIPRFLAAANSDLTRIESIDALTARKVIAERGVDMSRFPSDYFPQETFNGLKARCRVSVGRAYISEDSAFASLG